VVDVILAPDVFVNASVAPGTTPDRVVQRVLGRHKGESRSSAWVFARIESMLRAMPQFRDDAVTQQVSLIRSLVKEVPGVDDNYSADAWDKALSATAKAAGVGRVITDHPDLLKLETRDGVEFISTEAWLLEATTPPPVPT
jgi:hypothetical protein